MRDLTLVVMAAGMGSRFGGLKQLQPVDDDGNFLLDYSVYDAIKAGFNKVVFVIKEELLDDFKNTIGKRIEGKIIVDYAFQRLEDNFAQDKSIIKERVKPWGTASAIYCTKDLVPGNFAVINADDFYGFDAYKQVANFFENNSKAYNYVAVPYEYGKTASDCGAVKRGLCEIEFNKIKNIKECSIEKVDKQIVASPLDGQKSFVIDEKALVSMNLFGFSHDFYELLLEYLKDFFKQDRETILKSEALLPECLTRNLEKKKITIHSQPALSEWIGMTYKEDLPLVKEKISKLKEKGSYPKHLWD